MHRRGLGAFLIAAAVAAVGCGDDPAPLTGEAFWVEGCNATMSGANCTTNTHALRGARGGAISTSCSVQPAGSGRYSYSFELVVGPNIDQSTEGVVVDVTDGAVGSPGTGGTLIMAGTGWRSNTALGPTSPCRVELTRVSGKAMAGRFQCTDLPDDQVPPRQRFVRGARPQTTENEWAEFSFSNCD